MIRKALSLAMFFLSVICISAQQLTPLPLNPAVKTGKLPNGLTYYILHNEEPKNRADFYIAQKVGSTLEEPTQLGLAHFLEHMAFNGTKNFPGKNMLNYLQSKGIRFGADINAYTYYDETVYNINNVPTTDQALMDSVLLAIHDWSGSILLEDAEIDAERGVIEGEWLSRNDANFRMLESVLPKIYSEYQYQQPVIGKMDIIRNFPYSEIRNYYKKWYRPDQQGVVIVGDFDADAMEKKVIDLFSTIPMPENAAERTYPEVSNNEKPIFAYFDDPETRFPQAIFAFKYDKAPVEYRNTLEVYLQDELMKDLITIMINNRLTEYMQKPECKYAYAGVSFGDFWVSKTKGAFEVIVVGKTEITEAFNEAMAIVARACKTGFTDSEVVRARDEMLASYEKAYNERNKTNSEALAKGLFRHFIDNTPNPGAEKEYELAKQYLPMIKGQVLNAFSSQLLTPQNQVVVVTQPKKEGMEVVTEENFMASAENVINAEYEAYVDEVITDPLISKLPKAGKIKSEKAGAFETTEFMLSNGVKVVVKPTDFKADEILLTAFANGGKRSYPAAQALDARFASDAYNVSKLGNFNQTTLSKYLAGKNVSLGFDVNNTINSFSGSTTVKDLRCMMEMIYASFTEVAPDADMWKYLMDQMRTMLTSQVKDPNYIFNSHVMKARYGNNPMFNSFTLEDLDKIDYLKSLDLYKKAVSNAADYTFVFTGNVNLDSIRPLLEQYIATLPANAKKLTKVSDLTSLSTAAGQIKDEWKQPMQAPNVMVYDLYSGTNIPYNVENSAKMDIVGDLLDNVFIETLREEEGGTYSPSAGAALNPNNGEWNIIYLFITNGEMQEKMIKRANVEFDKLLANGTTQEAFNKVKEATLKQYENQIRTNRYWDNNLVFYFRGIDDITGAREAIEKLTLNDINSFMRGLYNGKNRIQVIMEGAKEK